MVVQANMALWRINEKKGAFLAFPFFLFLSVLLFAKNVLAVLLLFLLHR